MKFAVILAGCGNKDGSEIQEAVLTLLSIDQQLGAYQCFAPDISQVKTINFLTNEELPDRRSVLLESARIARSDIKPLSDFNHQDFDVLVIPGGRGVALNLCTFAKDGVNMTVNADVKKAVLAMHKEGKPIGALCIAPVIIAKLIPNVKLTFGDDQEVAAMFTAIGVKTIKANADDVIVDEVNKIVTTPCYMVKTGPAQMYKGINNLIIALKEMV